MKSKALRFRGGHATAENTVGGESMDVYTFRVRQGKEVRVAITERDGDLNFALSGPPQAPEDFARTTEGVDSWQGKVPVGGIYSITLTAHPNPSHYRLKVSIR